jgi:hypothetical protein
MATDHETGVGMSPQPPQDGRWAIFVPASYKNMALGEAELHEHVFNCNRFSLRIGAGAGAGGAAVRSPGLYTGAPMTHHDEHDGLAIRAIIQHHMPKRLTVAEIAKLAGLPGASNSAFTRGS